MKTVRFFRLLTLRVIVYAIIAIAWSYLTEYIQENTQFFGDILYKKYSFDTYKTWDWGWRHYIWNGFSIALSIIYLIRVIIWADWYWTQVKRNDNVDKKSYENRIF